MSKRAACFSASGVTEARAKELGKFIGAELYEIAPAARYISADLDFVISDSDMEILKHVDRIDNYGDSSFFPVFGGTLKGYAGKPGTEEIERAGR